MCLSAKIEGSVSVCACVCVCAQVCVSDLSTFLELLICHYAQRVDW